ncbi:unnamed protein product [Parascedosporium putredinis]|uniref:DUF985 domain-containing protein n=1 Tax=Parascedosporium putredinis TaxID=1442378 RepID=A0A9P1GX59_9PEZI|nr:unnamed protein product [Parascedosporium putredinis]CAI7990258.1 unnamed protein product [Parascedosporium putredinis]
MNHLSAEQVIKHLNLSPHPEKGYFIEKFRDRGSKSPDDRAPSTAIYYLLEGSVGYGEWHRVDAAEVWHYYAGAPLRNTRWRLRRGVAASQKPRRLDFDGNDCRSGVCREWGTTGLRRGDRGDVAEPEAK